MDKKLDKKKILIIISIVLIVVSLIILCFVLFGSDKEDKFGIDGMNVPQDKAILRDVSVGGLKVTDVSVIARKGGSVYKAKVTNETDKPIKINNFNVLFYEFLNESIISALSSITLEPKESTNINVKTETDLSKITRIEYTVD